MDFLRNTSVGLTLGFSVGLYCFLTCGVTLAGLLSSGGERGTLAKRTLLYFAGRLLVYGLLAVLFVFLSERFEHILRNFRQPLYILTGLYLVLMSDNRKNCPAGRPMAAFLLGVVNSLQPCPPFFSLIASGLASGGGWNTIILFLSFYVASSLVLLPALLPGFFGRFRFIQGLGRLALSTAATVFLFLGSFDILNPAATMVLNDSVLIHYIRWGCVLAIAVLAVVTALTRNEKLGTATRIISILLLGVVSGLWISANDLTGLFHGAEIFAYLSPLLVLVGLAFISSFFGRNLFCESVCPFGNLSEEGHRLCRRFGVKVFDSDIRILRPLRYVVLAVFILFFLIPARPFFLEPFASLFRPVFPFIGFFLAVFVLSLSILDRRFYCKYLCVAGAGLDLLPKLRLMTRVREIKKTRS